MNSKKPKLLMNGHSDQFQTPRIAWELLKPFIKKDWLIWECAWGKGKLMNYMQEDGFKVIGKECDFLNSFEECDCIITNPPYSLKDEFLERCYAFNKPFALLMPLTALEGKKRGKLYAEHGIQLIIPNKRINFETPSGKQGGSWFQTAWFCYGLNLLKELNFIKINKR